MDIPQTCSAKVDLVNSWTTLNLVILVYFVGIVLIVLFPPWEGDYGSRGSVFLGFHPIWTSKIENVVFSKIWLELWIAELLIFTGLFVFVREYLLKDLESSKGE